MCLHYYRARKSIKLRCTRALSFLNLLKHNVEKSLFMKDWSQHLQTTCHSANNNSTHLMDSKFAITFCWLTNDLSCYVFSKNTNGQKKLIMLKQPLFKMLLIFIFQCLCEYVAGVFLNANETVKRWIELQIHFGCTIWNLREKEI